MASNMTTSDLETTDKTVQVDTSVDKGACATDNNKETFLTYEGMEVSICSGNIAEFAGGNSACIVNPTNDRYKSTGAISKVLDTKGGERYKTELHGLTAKRPNVGDCSCTTAGEMKVTKVIHLVCPGSKWSPQVFNNKKCGANIIRSIHNCLKTAEDQNMETIVFPFIYTGNLGRPVKGCCLLYAYAVLEYSRTMQRRENRTLKKIVFLSNIDKDVGEAVRIFEKTIPRRREQWLKILPGLFDTGVTHSGAHTTQDRARSSCSSFESGRTNQDTMEARGGHDVDENSWVNASGKHALGASCSIKRSSLKAHGGVVVDFVVEDIRSYFVRALVCPVGESQDEVSGNTLIGASIKAAYSAIFCDYTLEERISKKVHNIFGVRNYVTMTPCNDLAKEDGRRTKFIFHVVFPTYKQNKKRRFEEDVMRSLDALFEAVQLENNGKRAVIQDLAFPIFGLDSTSDEEVVREACTSIARSLHQSLLKVCASTPFKMTIHFVNWCPKLLGILEEAFNNVRKENAS